MRHRWDKAKLDPQDDGWDKINYNFSVCRNCKLFRYKIKPKRKNIYNRFSKKKKLERVGYYLHNRWVGNAFLSCNEIIMKDVLE